ncbi:MAG: YggS family pyridoxal phosphate-dependent enzyme [Patescibacteria group bacterium]|jgi:hypothetical protein
MKINFDKKIKIIAVIKNRSLHDVNKIILKNNIKIIGINKIQEYKKNFISLRNIEKHFIGHLQSNKINDLLKYFDCLQTLDDFELAKQINEKTNKIFPVMIQINISKDPNKYGILPENAELFLKRLSVLKKIKVIGLMTITAKQNIIDSRSDYRKMRNIFNICKDKYNLQELSMGMSDDYKIAIEEGATMVRLGRILFEKND